MALIHASKIRKELSGQVLKALGWKSRWSWLDCWFGLMVASLLGIKPGPNTCCMQAPSPNLIPTTELNCLTGS